MSRKSWVRKLIWLMVLCSLTFSQIPTALAQTEDEAPPTGAFVEKGIPASGESSSIDTGKNYVYLPLLQGEGTADVAAAATDAGWTTVFYDEFCSFPNGWTRRDYNASGVDWTYRTFGGYCTAQPSAYYNKMNVFMMRTFSLAKAKDAKIEFRFQMQAEPYWDYFVTEYSCDGGLSWQGSPSSRSNPPAGWVVRTMSLKGSSCLKKASVTVRFGFTTDASVTGPIAPVLDYVWIQKK